MSRSFAKTFALVVWTALVAGACNAAELPIGYLNGRLCRTVVYYRADEPTTLFGLRKAFLRGDDVLAVVRRPEHFELGEASTATGVSRYAQLLTSKQPPNYAAHRAEWICSWDLRGNVVWFSTLAPVFGQYDHHLIYRLPLLRDVDGVLKPVPHAEVESKTQVELIESVDKNGGENWVGPNIHLVFDELYAGADVRASYAAAVIATGTKSFRLLRIGSELDRELSPLNDPQDHSKSLDVRDVTLRLVEMKSDAPLRIGWLAKRETQERTADFPYRGPFQAIPSENDLFLLTTVGDLYRVNPDRLSKKREPISVRIRDGETIQALIYDADRENRPFAFTSHYWFEIKEPLEYHEFALPTHKADDPLPTLVQCAREVRKLYPAVAPKAPPADKKN